MVNQNQLIDLLLELVKIDAVTYNEKPVTDFLIERFKQWNIPFEEDNAGQKIKGNSGNLIVRLETNKSSDDSVLFAVHLDTVSSTGRVNPKIDKKGIIRSDGSTILGADNRAGVAIVLNVLKEIAARSLMHRNLEIVFTVAEEVGMLGAAALDFSKLKSREAYIFDCSHKPGGYVVSTPTAIDFNIDFYGKAAHSGVAPEKGINALSMAVEVIQKFPVGRIDEQTVSNIGVIKGGTAVNVVPDKVSISGEIRSFNHSKIDSTVENLKNDIAQIEQKYKGQIEPSFSVEFDGFQLDNNLRVVKNLEQKFKEMNITSKPLNYYGGSDANVFNKQGIAAVNVGIGVQNPHSNNEQIAVKDLVNSTELMMRLIDLEEK